MQGWLNKTKLSLKALFRRRQLDRDLDDEVEFHLAMREQKIRAAGVEEGEARYAARRQFGSVSLAKERSRKMWTFAAAEALWQDLRFGVRMLRKNLGFTIIAVAILALATGANTALFSVVKGVLLNSLPYAEPDRLVTIARGDAQTPNPTTVSFGETEDWKKRSRSFQGIALYRGWSPTGPGNPFPEMVFGLRVTANFFDVLRVSPVLGRNFLPEEDGPERWHVVVLSHPYWMSRFGGDPNVVGKTILLNQVPFQIVGVLPRTFDPLAFTDAGSPPDVWAPLGYSLSQPDACRTCQHLHAVARLKDGIAIKQTRAEMNAIATSLALEFPNDYPPDAKVAVQQLRTSWYGNVQVALWLLLGATGFVLLIACANVANLLLARATQRSREVAVRSALGATRSRILRQLITESTILSLSGGVAGVFLAVWGTGQLAKWAPQEIPRLTHVAVDRGVLLFALAVSMAVGILMGVAPALLALRVDPRDAMQQSSRSVLGGKSRFRTALVCVEVCLAFLLTVSSGLLLKSFLHAWRVDPGFQVQNLYEANFRFVGAKYNDDKTVVRAQEEVLERVSHIPGVEAAGLVSTPPIAGGFGSFDRAGFIIQDRRTPDPSVPYVDRYVVSPDYFRAMGIPLLRGRLFSQADAAGENRVALISEMTARQIFPGEDPIGKRIQLGGRHDEAPWAEIVGIVGDVRQYGLDSPVTPQAYLLFSQYPFSYAVVLMVRSNAVPVALTRQIQEQIADVDKNTLLFNPAMMTEILSHSLVQRRFTMSLLAGFGALALLLAALGIYGVMSCSVAQRTGEIGIRVAIGASASDVARMVLREAALIVAVSLAAGWVGSAIFTRVLQSLLFEVSRTDLVTLLAVSITVVLVAVASALVPTWRAMRVDPMVALRYE